MEKSLIVNYDEITFFDPEKELGRGGFGRVLQATFQNRTVAIKVLSGQFERTIIEKEATILSQHKHPNIVTFLGVFYDIVNGIILELMEGGSLNDVLHEYTHVQYSYCHIAKWSMQILTGLEYLHDEKVIHRDLKPLNMLLSDNFLILKLSDFGTVREINTTMTSFQGTAAYMAPEVITHKYDHRCDIYSFGTVLWELLARKLPGVNKNGLPNKIKNHSKKAQELIKNCWSDTRSNRPTIDKIKRVIVKKFFCIKCRNECVPLTDTLTKKRALASKIIKQPDKTKYIILPAAHLSSQIEEYNNKNNSALLFQICYEEKFEIAKLLLESGADANIVDENGNTPLHIACSNGHFEIADLLLDQGAKINAVNKDGLTSLHVACECRDFETVKLLIENKANINAVNKEGLKPLHFACCCGYFEIVEFLLNMGADITIKDNCGKIPKELLIL